MLVFGQPDFFLRYNINDLLLIVLCKTCFLPKVSRWSPCAVPRLINFNFCTMFFFQVYISMTVISFCLSYLNFYIVVLAIFSYGNKVILCKFASHEYIFCHGFFIITLKISYSLYLKSLRSLFRKIDFDRKLII